jgi:LmbE family N-acetylglucosaminyl deacetylase
MNVVSLMAHQDDEMRCLGTMLKCRARGDSLWFITLTNGAKGFVHCPDIASEEAARIRHEEMSALAAELGAEYVNLREPDEFLYDSPDLRMKVIEAIRRTGAHLIFTHFEQDYNADHTTTAWLVRHCAMQSCLPVLPTPTPPLPEHPAIFTVEPFGPFGFVPTHFVDISDCEEEKVRLLGHHRSQDEAMRAAVGMKAGFGDVCGRSDAYWGQQAGCAFAEAFVSMRARGAIKPYNVLP